MRKRRTGGNRKGRKGTYRGFYNFVGDKQENNRVIPRGVGGEKRTATNRGGAT